MATLLRGDRIPLAACCLMIVFAMREPLQAQAPGFSITLTGQSMIRSDIRAHAPAAVPVITSLLKGDVIFTNFESTVIDEKKGQSRKDGRFLSPPEALGALKAFGFNLVSLANNHSWDLKVAGIQNTLQEAARLNLAHAGTGNTLAEAAAPAYLRTPKGTVALVAMASGLVEEGGSAAASKPGVNELRVEAGTPNEEDSKRILQSIREARTKADLVIVYEHNHVFDKPFRTIMLEELPERLRPPDRRQPKIFWARPSWGSSTGSSQGMEPGSIRMPIILRRQAKNRRSRWTPS